MNAQDKNTNQNINKNKKTRKPKKISKMTYEEVERLHDRELMKKWFIQYMEHFNLDYIYEDKDGEKIRQFYDKVKQFNDIDVMKLWIDKGYDEKYFIYHIRTEDFEIDIRDGKFFITFFNSEKECASWQGRYPIMKVSPHMYESSYALNLKGFVNFCSRVVMRKEIEYNKPEEWNMLNFYGKYPAEDIRKW